MCEVLRMSSKHPLLSKRVGTILILALLLAGSVFGFTLASYIKEASLFGQGWVGPKYYAFEVESSNRPEAIAPGESTVYHFTVRNYNDGGTAQVPLKVLIRATFPTALAGTGKVVAVIRTGDQVLGTSETGTLECNGLELSPNTPDTDSYTLTLSWMDADIDLLSGQKGTVIDPLAVSIRVSGYQ